jgi:hypothetical protein
VIAGLAREKVDGYGVARICPQDAEAQQNVAPFFTSGDPTLRGLSAIRGRATPAMVEATQDVCCGRRVA